MAVSDEALVSIIRNQPAPMQTKEMALLTYRYARIIRIKASKLKTADIEADDLQQEGFIALFSAVKAYSSDKGSFSSFADVCIGNRMKNAVLRARRYEKAEDYDFEQIQDDSAPTDDFVILKEYNTELFKRLSQILSQREFSVIGLYMNGYSYKQIAEKLGTSVKSVDNSLSRARQKLKKLF